MYNESDEALFVFVQRYYSVTTMTTTDVISRCTSNNKNKNKSKIIVILFSALGLAGIRYFTGTDSFVGEAAAEISPRVRSLQKSSRFKEQSFPFKVLLPKDKVYELANKLPDVTPTEINGVFTHFYFSEGMYSKGSNSSRTALCFPTKKKCIVYRGRLTPEPVVAESGTATSKQPLGVCFSPVEFEELPQETDFCSSEYDNERCDPPPDAVAVSDAFSGTGCKDTETCYDANCIPPSNEFACGDDTIIIALKGSWIACDYNMKCDGIHDTTTCENGMGCFEQCGSKL